MDEPQRPLTVAHVDAERDWSGGQVQVFLLLEGLRARGVRTVLCCPPGSRSEQVAHERKFDVQTVPMRNDLHLTAVPRLARAFRQAGADLVHLHTGRANALGGPAARLAGKPALTTRRMDGRVRGHPLNRWLYGTLVRRAVAISPTVAGQLASGGVNADKVVVIPSSVDPEALRPSRSRAEMRAEWGFADADVVLLCLAGLVRRKGVDVLLAALARLRRETGDTPPLLVAGDGPERDALQIEAGALGLERVVFLGPRDDAANLLAACDVFVMPSRREGLGIAALEAMAAARAVVGSRVGGLADAIVDEQTGLLVPPDDPRALAAALGRLLGDDELRRQLGAAGPARIDEGFHHHQMVEAYIDLYHAILDESRS